MLCNVPPLLQNLSAWSGQRSKLHSCNLPAAMRELGRKSRTVKFPKQEESGNRRAKYLKHKSGGQYHMTRVCAH